MKEFYESNTDFHIFVDKYCDYYKVTVDAALQHRIVKYTAEYYGMKPERSL